jgi:serine/threonine-protein kinase
LPEELARTFLSAASGIAIRRGSSGRESLVSATEESETEIEQIDERYVVIRDVGRGGMGRVEEVFDSALGRSVARKVLLRELGEGAAPLLIAEAQTCAQLEHPAIVPVYDIDSDAHGYPRYTMRFVQGRSLRDVLVDNASGTKHTPLAQLLGILRQVCLAIDFAHAKGVVHRDLKPENVMLGDYGEVYVLDWGIAHITEASDIVREDIGPLHAGSPGYMAPEQALSEPITPKTDVFALGVMLYEILTGSRPFADDDLLSIAARSTRDFRNAPSSVDPSRIPSSFDTLVLSCLARNPDNRPASARFIADAIDAYLDQERSRAEREADAEAATREGNEALALAESLSTQSKKLIERSEAMLDTLAPHDPIDKKRPAWELEQQGRQMGAEAARALARASAAFTRALGRVEGHPGARAGLAKLYYRQFLSAEEAGDAEAMAQYLDLARTYDDGPLALELANQGELVVVCSHPGAELSLARYELRGWLYELGPAAPLAHDRAVRLEVGSYVVFAKLGDRTARFPIKIRRTMRHTLRAELGALATLPKGMILIPGGPFFSPAGRSLRMQEHHLPDFAIGEFPVTLGEYIEFLDSLSDEERERRLPRDRGHDQPDIVKVDGEWRLTEYAVEGEGRKRVEGRFRELPVVSVSYFDALAYIAYLKKKTGLPYRLPTSLEWDKAARGVDGRPYPMGVRMDPVFAKLRESRPEVSQPEPVGAFPLDVSPFGVRDVAGGVQDWTSPSDGETLTLEAEADASAHQRQAIIRGGAWTLVRLDSRISRGAYRVIDRTGWVGFRLALDIHGAGSSCELAPMRP